MGVGNVFWAVDWIERDSWSGPKLSHTTWHENKQAGLDEIDKYWKEEKVRNPSGRTPEFYYDPQLPVLREKKED